MSGEDDDASGSKGNLVGGFLAPLRSLLFAGSFALHLLRVTQIIFYIVSLSHNQK